MRILRCTRPLLTTMTKKSAVMLVAADAGRDERDGSRPPASPPQPHRDLRSHPPQGCPDRRGRGQASGGSQTRPRTTYVPAPAGDPYGFTAWLNATRASYGLSAVGYDPNLSGWAARRTTRAAVARDGPLRDGPGARQNSAMGNSARSARCGWRRPRTGRPCSTHDPLIGIAGLGAYWTFNAN